ncbi:hypothetical protein ACJX0J_019198, partial [Zea mays]
MDADQHINIPYDIFELGPTIWNPLMANLRKYLHGPSFTGLLPFSGIVLYVWKMENC